MVASSPLCGKITEHDGGHALSSPASVLSRTSSSASSSAFDDTPPSSQDFCHSLSRSPCSDVFGPVLANPISTRPSTPITSPPRTPSPKPRPAKICSPETPTPSAGSSSPFTHLPLPRRQLSLASDSAFAPSPLSSVTTTLDSAAREPASGPSRTRFRVRTAGDGSSVPHPYARLYETWAEEAAHGKKRRQWVHALEHNIFTPEEQSRMRAAHRRRIYISSLEAHIDRLHTQLIGIGLFPVPFGELTPFKGMSNTAGKSMLSALQQDIQQVRSKQTEIERANLNLRRNMEARAQARGENVQDLRRASLLEVPSQLGDDEGDGEPIA